jgi:signal transduction histidine kinase
MANPVNLRQSHKLELIGRLATGIAHEIHSPVQYVSDNMRFLDDAFGRLSALVSKCLELGDGPAPPAGDGRDRPSGATAAEAADLALLIREIPAAIRQSRQGVDRIARIVRTIGQFSHPGGEYKEAADLNQIVEGAVAISRSEWLPAADMVTDLTGDLPEVTCLPADLSQVLLNLVINAVHAIQEKTCGSSKKGAITISTRRDGGWAEIRVRDTGAGIPQAIRDRVFDPFFTTKKIGAGTGQGLSIARSVVVEKHGGSITFESDQGGTTFLVRIPIQPDPLTGADDRRGAADRPLETGVLDAGGA